MGTAESLTLVFELDAARRFIDPAVAVDEASTWATYVGIVSNEDAERIRSFADRTGTDPDFTSSLKGQTGGLAVARQQYRTDRHVFVAVDEGDLQFARSLGWEAVPLPEAAEKADWKLAEQSDRWSDETEQ